MKLSCAVAAATVLALGVLVSVSGANHATVELVAPGAEQGTYFAGASTDGTRVLFTTPSPLAAGDTDTAIDIYERSGSTIRRISTGSTGGNASFDATFLRASSDGTRVFFTTAEPLEPGDTDTAIDVYQRFGSTTTLISTGSAGGNANLDASFAGATPDGTRVFIHTREPLEPGDTETRQDVYERFGSTTTRISTGSNGGNSPELSHHGVFRGVSADGARVFFDTREPIEPGDVDAGGIDIYERFGSTTTLISIGPTGGNLQTDAPFHHVSTDGTRVVFSTGEALVADDTDGRFDVYQRFGSTITRISTGSSGGSGDFHATHGRPLPPPHASADGTRVFFETAEPLEPGDTDTQIDVYERFGSTTTLISTGSSGGNGTFIARFAGASADGTRVFFETEEPVEAGDTDTGQDIYERAGPTTTLISTGTGTGGVNHDATFARASTDGTRVFFTTWQPLVPDDTDTLEDVYERFGSTTTQISPRASGQPTHARFAGASADGSRVFFRTGESLRSGDTNDGYSDVYVAALASTAGYPRPIGASPIHVSLVPAYDECTSPNAGHPAPFAGEACNPPNLSSDHLTVGTPDANGKPAKSSGLVRFHVLMGTPGGADDSDASLDVSLTDVRNQGSLTDHTGELRMSTELRITDKTTGTAGTAPGTVVDLPLDVTVPCSATADTTIGGSCSITTTLDSLLGANAVPEGKRAIYDLVGGVDVFDGGADGDADTPAGDTLFVTDGFFVP